MSDLYLFDAYGTLLDLAAAARRALAGRDAEAALLAEVWRARQLEYAWTDMALGRSTDFWDATGRALDTALVITGLTGDGGLRARLLDAYAALDAYPDARPAIERIAAAGGRSIVYSNANLAMLLRSLAASGLDRVVDGIESVDGVGVYKPDPRAYAHILTQVGPATGAAPLFVSANAWDAAGATRAGLRAVWINRQDIPYPFPATPPFAQCRDLGALPL